MANNNTISTGVSAARFAANPTVLGGVGLGLGLVGGMMGRKNKKKSFVPGFQDGKYINQVTGKPWENANNMVIQGDKGTYDLIPQIGKASADYAKKWQLAQGDISGSTDMPSADRILYETMRGSLGDDAAALAAFDKRYPLRTGGMTAENQSPQMIKWLAGVDRRYSPDYKYQGVFNGGKPMISLGNGLTNVRDTIGSDLESFGTFANQNNLSRNAFVNTAAAEFTKSKKYNSLLSKPASRASTATTSSILAQAKG